MSRVTKESLLDEIQRLEAQKGVLERELKKQKDNVLILTMELVRVRRWAGLMDEECSKAKEECAEAKRKYSNIRKWMEHKGIYSYSDPDATDEIREDFKYEQI